MRSLIAVAIVVATTGAIASHTSSTATNNPQTRETFLRVYSVNTPNLTAPVLSQNGQRSPTGLRGATVELEITVGGDGRVRDAMVTKGVGGTVDAAAVRAAANSRYQPGRLNHLSVAVRMPFTFKTGG